MFVKKIQNGWEIRIVMRNSEAEIELYNPDGDCVSQDWDSESRGIYEYLTYARKAEENNNV